MVVECPRKLAQIGISRQSKLYGRSVWMAPGQSGLACSSPDLVSSPTSSRWVVPESCAEPFNNKVNAVDVISVMLAWSSAFGVP